MRQSRAKSKSDWTSADAMFQLAQEVDDEQREGESAGWAIVSVMLSALLMVGILIWLIYALVIIPS
jgi:hypothetical protein